ncbi:flagellar protein FlaG [Desulfonatronovibrio magnus]|uniref:flagellar protein FlaG n=1 Tax=Desulfonatronovibrio magnus TaxID=698827 RepID=UPI0005EB4943|nr:flagellar protein FlaG [Desulfonatronovibrio magnus]RQD66635.1 MAG: flagellar protein FlaG [Desulfonatronovibrio sp. MSAO_Bac4]
MNLTESPQAVDNFLSTTYNRQEVQISHRKSAQADLPPRIPANQADLSPKIADNTELSKLEHDKLVSATNSVKEYMDSMGIKLEFQVLRDGDGMQVKVLDSEGERVIRKIPADEMLKLAESIEEMLGLFVNKTL